MYDLHYLDHVVFWKCDFMIGTIRCKWVVSERRKDKRTGAISPVARSEYAKLFFDMGWKNESSQPRKRQLGR